MSKKTLISFIFKLAALRQVFDKSCLRPRLHGTRQICIQTNNRADTVCVYTALPYPCKFLTCHESVLVPTNICPVPCERQSEQIFVRIRSSFLFKIYVNTSFKAIHNLLGQLSFITSNARAMSEQIRTLSNKD